MENINAVATEADEYGIRAIMGERFEDLSKQETVSIKTEKPRVYVQTQTAVGAGIKQKQTITQTFSNDKQEWVKRGKYLGQMAAAAVVNLLVFGWQQNGLMDASIATPCMWAAMAVAGYNVCRIIVSLEREA